MINLDATNEWQHRDPETGLVFPWYTKSFLDELVTWDLSDKKVCEYGGGASTVWWNKKAKHVFTVESSEAYFDALIPHIGHESLMFFTTDKDKYINWAYGPHGGLFDIIIIDGEPISWRDDCVKPAIDCLKPGGRLIFDNWLQPSVEWMPNEETQRVVTSLPHNIYSQDGHPDWKTLVATKP
jgi:predicted O-methyltransferase YrrM